MFLFGIGTGFPVFKILPPCKDKCKRGKEQGGAANHPKEGIDGVIATLNFRKGGYRFRKVEECTCYDNYNKQGFQQEINFACCHSQKTIGHQKQNTSNKECKT